MRTLGAITLIAVGIVYPLLFLLREGTHMFLTLKRRKAMTKRELVLREIDLKVDKMCLELALLAEKVRNNTIGLKSTLEYMEADYDARHAEND